MCRALSWLVVAAPGAAAATINVTTMADDGGSGTAANCPGASCSLRDAIAYGDANAGTTIDVPTGEYDLTGTQLQITAPMTIVGQGASPSDTKIVQQASSGARVLEIKPTASGTVSISSVEITGGNLAGAPDAKGGGILIDPIVAGVVVALTGDLVDGNTATGNSPTSDGANGGVAEGAGIAIPSGHSPTLTLSGTTVSNNIAHGGDGHSSASNNGGSGGGAAGGGIYDGGSGALEVVGGSTVSGNTVTGGKGGQASTNTKTVGTSGSSQGGGVYGGQLTPVTITDSAIDNNAGTGSNGANAVSGQADGAIGGASVSHASSANSAANANTAANASALGGTPSSSFAPVVYAHVMANATVDSAQSKGISGSKRVQWRRQRVLLQEPAVPAKGRVCVDRLRQRDPGWREPRRRAPDQLDRYDRRLHRYTG